MGVKTDGAPTLDLQDKDNMIRAWLALNPDGAPYVALLDEIGKTRAALGHTEIVTTRTGAVEQRPPSSLVFFDKDGTVMWKAP